MKTKIILAATALGLGTTIYFFKLSEIAAMTRVNNDSSGTLLNYPNVNRETVVAASFNEVVSEYVSADEIFKEYRETPQEFVVKNDAEVSIVGKAGTQIHFPANALVHADGSKVDGEIRITLMECYDMADMVINELSTTSNDALLETSGMVRIEAFHEGKRLKLDDDKRYTVAFPQASDKDDFKLFYGQREANGGINWILAEQPNEIKTAVPNRMNIRSENDVNSESENCFIQINKSYFRRHGKIALMDFYTWKTTDGQLFNNWFIANFNPPIEMVNAFCDLNYQSEVTIKFDAQGNVKERHLTKRSTPQWDLEILKLVDGFPTMDISSYMPKYDEDHGVILQFGKHIGKNQERTALEFEKKFGKGDTVNVVGVTKADLDYYIFASSQLGWLNCDRFYEETEKVDFYVDLPNAQHTTVSLAFSNYRGLISGMCENDRVVFRGIPKDEKAMLVAVECVAGSPRMLKKSVNTTRKSTELKDFKPFKLKELKIALNAY